jgi:hypothetical protein
MKRLGILKPKPKKITPAIRVKIIKLKNNGEVAAEIQERIWYKDRVRLSPSEISTTFGKETRFTTYKKNAFRIALIDQHRASSAYREIMIKLYKQKIQGLKNALN